MGRRRLVVLVSALAMLLIGSGVVGALVAATQSDGGRDWIRRQVVRQLSRGLKGKLYLGRLSGSFLTDLAIDSLQITDPDDSVFIAAGAMHFTYDPRDIADGRIIIRSVDVRGPFVVIRKENDERWNFRKVFPAQKPGPPEPAPARRAFGAIVVFRNVHLRGSHFQLTLPWEPDDSLHGVRRDSAIAENLAARDNEIRRVVVKGRPGFQRTWRWMDWNVTLTRARFRQPDTTGRQFDVARLDVNERVPPFAFRNLRGGFYWRGDSIWTDLSHFELPGSVGRAKGKVDWADNRPIRYDVRVHGDSVSLKDIGWISSNLPRTGAGSMDLRIVSERDPHVIDYAITNMDARTNGTRLRGSMTYGVGGPVLLVKDVDLQLVPVDFRFLETLNGGSFAFPWRGVLTGRVRAHGGPVNHFQVDEATLAFADRNVPGATASGTGSGEIDILNPGYAKFHGFHLDVAHFDLRTAQFLNPDFPAIRGVVLGSATLDSIWTDVRFHDADLSHRDGDDLQQAPVSRFKGRGRVTLGEENIRFDLTFAALPLSATTVARSYPRVPLRGEYSGPLRIHGDVSDLAVTGDLVGDAGRLQLTGQFGVVAARYRAGARGSVSGLDLRRALGRAAIPETGINGRFIVDLAGDSLADLLGSTHLFIDRSTVDGVRVYGGQAALRFDNGLAHVDSLRVESAAGLVTANGGLGLTSLRSESLAFRVVVDSLGGLRRYFARATQAGDSAVANAAGGLVTGDSLEGTIRLDGAVSGSLARLSVRAMLDGSELRVGATTARAVVGSVRLDGLPDSATGVVTVRVDTLHTGRMAFSRAAVRADLFEGRRAVASATAETPAGARVRMRADARQRGDSTDVRLDSLTLQATGHAWSLARPTTITMAAGGFAVDSLVFGNGGAGRLAISGRMPAIAPVALLVRADSIALADIGEFVQTADPLEGTATIHAEVQGTRAQPDLYFNGTLRAARLGGLRLDLVTADGRYANHRLTTSLEYSRFGVPALQAQATLPVDFSLQPVDWRLLEEPLTGRIRTDSVGLAVFESFSTSISGVRGALALDLDVAGTWRHPRLTGGLRVSDGALLLAPMGAAPLTGIEADVGFLGDSVAVRRLAVRSGASRTAVASLSGFIGIRDAANPTFDLRLSAQGFNVIKRPRFADLDLTGDVRLAGAFSAATLTGSLTVDRGTIYVPELYQKRVISLDDPEFYRVVDTSAFVERRLLPEPPTAFMNNLSVEDVPIQMGRDVWLRSEEANINLGGLVRITRRPAVRGRAAGQPQLALDGTLQTVRGTYQLNLGLVQRTFTVESGDIRFFGDPDLNPNLNINALHTVRQISQTTTRPDVRVRVHMGGTLLSPTAELSSPDSVRVTNADLISYLMTGGPSYAVAGHGADYTSAAANVLVSSFGSVLGGKASGGLCDEAQLSTAGLDAYQGRIRDVSANILQGTRFNCAKQVTERVFVRVDAGLCQVGQLVGTGNASTDPLGFADAIGVKLDYRMSTSVTASVGMDPSTSAMLCTRDANARGFAPTPRQFGLDLFRLWRF